MILDKNMEKYHWINSKIIIDFDIPLLLQNTIKEAEELDLQNNTEYFCVADIIDVICKEYCYKKIITHEQWNKIITKYPST